MEALAVILEPYRDFIISAAAIYTPLHQLSGVFVCNDIRKQNSTRGLSAMPFIAGFVISVLVTVLATLVNDSTMLLVNSLGTAINITYICFYYMYTNDVKEKTLVWAQLGYAGAFVMAVIAYTHIEDPKVLLFRYGILLTLVLFYFIGSPLLGLGEIIKRKSTEGLPFAIIFSGTIVSILWFLYGVITGDNFMVFQNGVIFVMSAIQLSLFAIYPSKPAKKSPKKKTN